MIFNEYQTSLDSELVQSLPKEVYEQLIEFVTTVPYIRNLVSKDRPRAKDLPRDDKGRIIVDLANPHILEDMDYFRPAVKHYEEYGCYTKLKPNGNPNSEFFKWIKEERRRCWEGYVRESDGEWVTGLMYWFLNYCPMMVNKQVEGTKRAIRTEGFASVWEGIYLRFHYLEQARFGGMYNEWKGGQHGVELARRGASKSYALATILSRNLILGESEISNKRQISILTAYQTEYLSGSKDGTFTKFIPIIDHVANTMEFPKQRLKNSPNEMSWQMGYVDIDTGARNGSLNQVMGVSSKDDVDKLRGKRGYILFEEFGSFKNLIDIYNSVRDGMKEGDFTFGLAYLVGTSGSNDSDFFGAQQLLYHPEGYDVYNIPNVYDKEGLGKHRFPYFFPSYINRLGCYNEDGVSDVIKALCEVLLNRYKVKYNTSDPNTLLSVIAEMPITPAEAILKAKQNMFPVTDLTARLEQIDANPNFYDDTYTGTLVQTGNGIEFNPTSSVTPIREFPTQDNKVEGAIEIYQMPEKDKNGKISRERYIIGIDPVDDDTANTMSLFSMFVLDLFTDKIVAEYTGRQPYANDNYEIVRKMCLFYNAKCLYEAHSYTQEVITPDGKKLWGDIKIGDRLFSSNGRIVKVTDIPVDTTMSIYKVTLKDGRTIECSDNHIWNIIKGTNKVPINITTQEMLHIGLKDKYNHTNFYIPNAGTVEYPYKKVPIDPYTLGLLIAEGAFTKFKKEKIRNTNRKEVQFSSCEEDCIFYQSIVPYKIKKIGKDSCTWHMYIDNIDTMLKDLGLLHKDSHTKFIPDLYLYNSIDVRKELLKGIMDGDGCANTKGAPVLVTTSKELKDSFMLLCRSLGINCSSKYISTTNSYRISLYTKDIVFKLPRKAKAQHVYKPKSVGSKASSFIDKVAIVNIEYLGMKQGKCVTVNEDDGLYLIGDYVLTHNCNKKGIYAYFNQMNCLYMLAETPEYLKDKQIIKETGYGNKALGVNATAAVNNYARQLIREWLIKPSTIIQTVNDEETEVLVPNLNFLKGRALIKELINWNKEANFDRVSALGILMIYREEKMILWEGDVSSSANKETKTLASDDFFIRNYHKKFGISINNDY